VTSDDLAGRDDRTLLISNLPKLHFRSMMRCSLSDYLFRSLLVKAAHRLLLHRRGVVQLGLLSPLRWGSGDESRFEKHKQIFLSYATIDTTYVLTRRDEDLKLLRPKPVTGTRIIRSRLDRE